MMDYAEFLAGKTPAPPIFGRDPDAINPVLYDFQQTIVAWAIKRGRAAVFADCGLGKTLIQLEWARQSGSRVLILAPLAVSEQTIREARKLGLTIEKVSKPTDAPLQTTNYEKLRHFIGADYDAIVLDESSILKSLDGKTRGLLLREFTHIPRRLCCTATPAPNDLAELANHSEFLGIMPRNEMLATFFVHDANTREAGGWRLKGHAQEAFWRWMAKWAVFVRSPADLGFDDGSFRLPGLRIVEDIAESDWKPAGMLFGANLGGIGDRRKARRGTLHDRIRAAVALIHANADQWIVWCALNDEGRLLAEALGPESVNIEGKDSEEEKISKEAAWRDGSVRVLITKPQMFGFGLNWQHCHRIIFLGLGDSYEQFYQAIRRCWRFGQTMPVSVHVVVSESERVIVDNVRRKEKQAAQLASEIVKHFKGEMMDEVVLHKEHVTPYKTEVQSGLGWRMMLGDSIEEIRNVEHASVDLSVFSPPFASLYTYSASERDLGNSKSYEQFFEHFRFLIAGLLDVTKPGRRACVHVQQVTTTLATHGIIGWRDFRADVVRHFVEAGWVYDGEVVIDKDPQAQAIRTKSKALMFVQKNKDSSWSRPAMADYILLFRRPGENAEPIVPDVSNEEWILWARPIWYGIRETATLNFREARTEKDDRHIAPLQLETIERCIRLWSNPGDTVFSPFAGIGSEGYVALQLDRKFVGIELKREYWQQAVKNLRAATGKALPLLAPVVEDAGGVE